MRTSQYLLSTLKETPADAEVISHVTLNDDDKKVTAAILEMLKQWADVVICT